MKRLKEHYSVECPECHRPTSDLVIKMDAPCPIICRTCATAPPIAGTADPERSARLDAERCTAEFSSPYQKPLDSGKRPITESPLFGGDPQLTLF